MVCSQYFEVTATTQRFQVQVEVRVPCVYINKNLPLQFVDLLLPKHRRIHVTKKAKIKTNLRSNYELLISESTQVMNKNVNLILKSSLIFMHGA